MRGPEGPDRSDAVVIGAGHHGLTCAAYLARAGLSVLVLEARDFVGGCSATVPAVGARVNLCNCDHSLVLANPLLTELDLAAHGLEYLEVDPTLAGTGWEGEPPVLVFRSPERTLEAWRATHPGSVEGYRRYLAAASEAARLLVAVSNAEPRPRAILGEVARAGGRGSRTILSWHRRSLLDAAGAFFDDERVLRPMAVTTAAVWGLPPSAPGTGLAALSYAVRHLVGVSRPRGGSGRLGEALRSALEEAGGRVSTGWRVARIDPDGPAVESRDGRRVAARVVVSAICPRRTFDLLGPARPADRLRRAMGEPVEGYQSKIDAVVGRLPDLDCFTPGLMGRLGMASPLVPSVVIAPSIDRMEDIARLRSQGRMAERPMMLLNIPSVLDPTMRPDGAHVLSLEVLFTPYRLEGGWNPSVPERWLAAFGSLAGPRFRQSVIDWRAVTPLDYERDFGLTRGNPPAFAGSPLDVLRRPGPLTRYATPWPGLYLTGAGTYPGGGVWGAAGRNAALRVLRDLR